MLGAVVSFDRPWWLIVTLILGSIACLAAR